jgi:1-acyl-sn-glycerol-3-phosphate acyltransferase
MTEASQFRLLAERRFAPFFTVQFLGALNDNVLKQALVILLVYQTATFSNMSADLLQNIAAALFVLPFFLFSATAGQLADKYEKSRLITATLAIELAVMILAGIGFLTTSLTLLLTALFLSGFQSALFGPVKYAILPQVLQETELVGGNALVESGTSLAILLGLILGGWLVTQQGWGVQGVVAATCLLSAAGLVVSLQVPRAPPAAPDLRINWNVVTETWRNLRFAASDRTIFNSLLGISWFWFYGAVLVTQFPNLSKSVLFADEQVVTLLILVFSVGIGLGSLLCERLSGHKVEIGLVPFGSIGLTVFGIDLGFASALPERPELIGLWPFLQDPHHWRLLVDLLLMGTFSGFYIVPLYALVQSRSDPGHRSRIIAGNNILNAGFMVLAALLSVALLGAGLTIPQLFVAVAVMNLAVALYIYALVPEFLMRFLVWMLIHSVYRLKKSGLERIPEEGAAVVVCNHVSYVDALIISAACRRPIRWVMDHRIFRIPVLSFFFRTIRAIPIAPAREDPAALEQAYDRISAELAAGELIGIFPEGRLTPDGEMGEFRGGLLRILERNPVPVVPMALSGLWQSLFARNRDKLRHAAKLFPKVGLAVGDVVQARDVDAETLRATVLELRGGWA